MHDDTTRPKNGPSRDELLDHDYDGIQEYDNPLPRWWVMIFWASIVFAPIYILFYHFGPGLSEHQQYERSVQAFYERQAKALAALGEVTDETLLTVKANPAMLSRGGQIFRAKCSPCHGMFGEGNIGPNLTDDYWIHGAKPTDIYHTIFEGVPDKGMLTWKNQLPPARIMAVAAYVLTLHGTSPPNPKAPQGTLVEPAETPVAPGAETPRGETSPPRTGA
ncbi:MAG: c-type cytochrome [Acidobacteria bacterium]|nr:c-type cytochrome [Acidobacteriota bacterium]